MILLKIKMNNNFIFINNSPWPIMLMINSMNFIITNMFMMNYKFNNNMIINMIMMIYTLMLWNFNLLNFKMIYGYKMLMINLSLKSSMMMFILSEFLFFLTFFYIDMSNKYFNILYFKKMYLNMFKLSFLMALMNLIILMTSSMTLMIFIKMNMLNLNNKFILVTIILSMYFISIQIFEYKFLMMNLSNSIFMTNFFLLTFFHMNHVIMGTMMMIMFILMKMMFMNNMWIKMTNICWYWHFIDFVWIMIFFIIYYFINMKFMFNFQLKKK